MKTMKRQWSVTRLGAGRRDRCRAGWTIVDLCALLILIPLSAVIILGCARRSHGETSNRVRCAANLRSIGQAILLYSNENKGAYPRTIATLEAEVIPVAGTGANAPNPFAVGGPRPNDVTAALFLLLRTQEITADVFVCPQSNAEKWNFGGGSDTALNWSNWEGAAGIQKHLSYSFQNPYPDDEAVVKKFKFDNTIGAEYAVAADMNPGTDKDGKGVLTVLSTSGSAQMRAANSLNHDGDGQNVLFGDGHVEFCQNPFVGVQKDNIYARRAGYDSTDLKSDQIWASPRDANDSVLLPTSH